MTRRLLAATGSVLALLAGLWLVLSPFALGFHSEGADWSDATLTDVWTGLPLALVGLIGLIVFAAALRTHLVQSGAITPRPAPAVVPAEPDTPVPGERSHDVDTLLEPLIAALVRDIEQNSPSPAVPALSTATADH